jgi:hypothetical protein
MFSAFSSFSQRLIHDSDLIVMALVRIDKKNATFSSGPLARYGFTKAIALAVALWNRVEIDAEIPT